jgi:hypothetical protein
MWMKVALSVDEIHDLHRRGVVASSAARPARSEGKG